MSAQSRGLKSWMMVIGTILHTSQLCHLSPPKSARLSSCLWVNRMRWDLIITFMTFQHCSMGVKCHSPQAVRYERGKSGLSTCMCVCLRPRLTLIPCSHAGQPCIFGLVFFINFRASWSSRPFVSLRPSGLYFRDPLYLNASVFHESDDVCIFVTNCPSDQKSGSSVIR